MARTNVTKPAAEMKPFRFLEKIVKDAGIPLEIVRHGPREVEYETSDRRIRLVSIIEDAPDPADASGWELNIHLMLSDENEVAVTALWDQTADCWKLFWDFSCEGDAIEPWLSDIIARHALGASGAARSGTDGITEAFVRDCTRAYLDTLPPAN